MHSSEHNERREYASLFLCRLSTKIGRDAVWCNQLGGLMYIALVDDDETMANDVSVGKKQPCGSLHLLHHSQYGLASVTGGVLPVDAHLETSSKNRLPTTQ